ncbi:hypothetical protein PPYR_01859 [Photinus pyralis]|uniref:Dynein axonemal assembly factor 1 homolog n=2 Tax=Photinus pyralis TaxID=7054 RepID=A0A5N4B5K7_PHOPY|nr:uncharacterized protein LOC116161973 [Photinus pyralis]XP_031354495.1 uncharacterized protein LOC116178965 [Photinus pyralis]KAB0804889.1 hypothetical protein PPYR_01859 [Photinus pyralis]
MVAKLNESYPSARVSQINVLQGSSPTLNVSNSSKNSEERVSESESSEDEFLVNWGPESPDPNIFFPVGWGSHGLEEDPWNDKNKPYVKLTRYEDLELNEMEQQGVLTDRILAACSSYLDKSPETNGFVLCKANLSKKFLKDIRIIQLHHFLQYVDLSYNDLTNVESLSELPFLMYLDVSHNCLGKLLNFNPPLYLTYVNYSFNNVAKINDLSLFWSLVHLDISHNQIKVIEGLQELKYLKHLNLSYNMIKCIENLNHMPLLSLNLESNGIETFEEGEGRGLKTLPDILKLNLDYNHLSTIKFCEGMDTLQSLTVQANNLRDLLELSYLRNLNSLSEVDFRDNYLSSLDRYFDACIYNVNYISVLDGEVIDAETKVSAKNVFEGSIQSEAFRNASTAMFIQQLNDPVLGLPIIPFDIPPAPIIILVGPPGSGKSKLLIKFCRLNPKRTVRGVSHTTRPKLEDNDQHSWYYHVHLDEFWSMARNGEFLTVSQVLGHCYGFAQQELAKPVGSSSALILHMDLKGALTLRAQNMKCHLVLAMPSSQEVHISNILDKYRVYNETIISRKGAPETKSAPLKAKELLERYSTIAQEIEKAAYYDSETWSDKVSLKSKEETESTTDLEKTAKYGILKSSIHRTKSDGAPPPIGKSGGVTFQSRMKKSRTLLHSSRSVTFNEETTSGAPTPLNQKSISGTILGETEVLSVLSNSSAPPTEDKAQNQFPCPAKTITGPNSMAFCVNEILKTRDSYLAFHQSNPGVLLSTIFTDREDEALEKLKGLLKYCIQAQSKSAPNYEFKKDSAYQAIVGARLKSLHREIENEMSIGQKQLDEFAHKTKQGKPYESHLKRSTKDVIEVMRARRNQVLGYKLPDDVGVVNNPSPLDLLDD